MKSRSNVYLLGFMVTLCVVIINSSAHSSYRNKPRSTRGFKNAALSAARGFGKRDGFQPGSNLDLNLGFDKEKKDDEELPNIVSPPERFSIDWFLEELLKDPRMAKILYNRFSNSFRESSLPSEELSKNEDYKK